MDNKVFGRLTVIGEKSEKKHIYWLCKCSCGNVKWIRKTRILSGQTKSCGCLRKEIKRTHGQCKTKLYRVWTSMRQRCNNPNNKRYKDYGGRGIKICDEWNNFSNFFKWANEHGYHEGLSIDRIDNDKGYSPQNCRWATMLTQNNNTRHCRRITYHGETHTVAEWERKLNMKCGILEQRLLRGMTLSDALSTPVKTCQTRYVTYKGKVMSLHGWAKHLGMNYSTFQSKINKGISMEDIIKEHNGR